MLTHHSHQDYNAAASDAAKHARARMEDKFGKGEAMGRMLLEHVENSVPDDFFGVNMWGGKNSTNNPRMEFNVFDDKLKLVLRAPSLESRLFDTHSNAISQLVGRFDKGPPGAYLTDKLDGETWRKELAAHTLNTFLQNAPEQRFLVRSLKDQVRAVMSDKYKRYDSRPLTHTFVDSVQEQGAYVTDGHVSDLRYNVKAFIPIVFEPVPNEVMCFGVEMTNSDFGGSRYMIRMVMWRLWCTNYATVEYGLKEVHMGGRLPEDIALSNKTVQLDTALMASATADIIRGLLNPAKISGVQDLIRTANDRKLEWSSAKVMLTKLFTKDELKTAETMFDNESDDILGSLPKAKSLYKVSQLIGWQANQVKDADRRMDLERAAGEVLMRAS